MRLPIRVFSAVLVASIGFAAAAPAQEWTRFRGPNGSGHGKGQAIPVRWTERDYNWRVKLPGGGHGSPVLWSDRIFLQCGDRKTAERKVVCLKAGDGSVAWTRDYPTQPFRMNRLNHYAGPTPAVDADRVYVCWCARSSLLVVALDHEGKELWRRDLGKHDSMHGPCTSPIVYEDLVIVPNDQKGPSSLVALEKATGKLRWQTPRKGGHAAYSTPCVLDPPGRAPELIFTSSRSGVAGVDPKTGKVNWQVSDAFPQRVVGSPVVAGGLVIGSCGTGGRGIRLVAVRPYAGQKPKLTFEMRRDCPYVPTPLVKDGRVFVVSDRGVFTCLQADNGKQLWQHRVRAGFYSSPVCVGEHLYFASRRGKMHVLRAGPEYKLLAENDLGEPTDATPAVAGGRMYLRTFSHLISIGGRAASAPAKGQ